MYTSVSRNAVLVFDIWGSNLMDPCFVLIFSITLKPISGLS